jgi:hypothetical protein
MYSYKLKTIVTLLYRQPSICQCQWLFLEEAKQSWPSFESFNIHKCTFTSRKSLNICTWSSAPYTVTEKLLYIIKGLMKVISGLLPETLGYFCMKNFISTTWNCHSYIHESTHFILFALLKVHPRFFHSFGLCMGPLNSCAPADTLSQWAWWQDKICIKPSISYSELKNTEICSLKEILRWVRTWFELVYSYKITDQASWGFYTEFLLFQ